MNKPSHDKVTQRHLNRLAYLYVRQSTIRQVIENIESTQRQYALKERAIALGWLKENVVIIDEDQGQSGANVADRKGFQTLVTEISLGGSSIISVALSPKLLLWTLLGTSFFIPLLRRAQRSPQHFPQFVSSIPFSYFFVLTH